MSTATPSCSCIRSNRRSAADSARISTRRCSPPSIGGRRSTCRASRWPISDRSSTKRPRSGRAPQTCPSSATGPSTSTTTNGRRVSSSSWGSGDAPVPTTSSFFESTFDSWKDLQRSGRERYYVGYSPVLVVDAEAILAELPDAHFVHVVRNPWSAYADTKKRPVPLPLRTYVLQWALNQHLAHVTKAAFGDRMHIVRLEDVVEDSVAALRPLCDALGIDSADPALGRPSWNSKTIDQVYPWGTIRTATPAANLATANELEDAEKAAVRRYAGEWIGRLGYDDFV
ncbi:MAG: sulfotransferase [Ilumatobacteraceae bacterium]